LLWLNGNHHPVAGLFEFLTVTRNAMARQLLAIANVRLQARAACGASL
jgi:hypothetical protein